MSLRWLNRGELFRHRADWDAGVLISIIILSFADDPSGLNSSRRYPYISMSVWGLSVWNIPDPRLICKKKTQLKCNSIRYWTPAQCRVHDTEIHIYSEQTKIPGMEEKVLTSSSRWSPLTYSYVWHNYYMKDHAHTVWFT